MGFLPPASFLVFSSVPGKMEKGAVAANAASGAPLAGRLFAGVMKDDAFTCPDITFVQSASVDKRKRLYFWCFEVKSWCALAFLIFNAFFGSVSLYKNNFKPNLPLKKMKKVWMTSYFKPNFVCSHSFNTNIFPFWKLYAFLFLMWLCFFDLFHRNLP